MSFIELHTVKRHQFRMFGVANAVLERQQLAQ
jgi:hypothetical protein